MNFRPVQRRIKSRSKGPLKLDTEDRYADVWTDSFIASVTLAIWCVFRVLAQPSLDGESETAVAVLSRKKKSERKSNGKGKECIRI